MRTLATLALALGLSASFTACASSAPEPELDGTVEDELTRRQCAPLRGASPEEPTEQEYRRGSCCVRSHLEPEARIAPTDVARLLREAGETNNAVIGRMVCIAKNESEYSPQAFRYNKNCTADRGLFQINDINVCVRRADGTFSWNGRILDPRTRKGASDVEINCHCTVGDPDELFDPAVNAACARSILRSRSQLWFDAWYGDKAECARAKAP